MFQPYLSLRRYCQQHEWAAALSAVLLIALLGTLIIGIMEYQSEIAHWLLGNLLMNGLILFIAAAVVVIFSMSIFCLSFSQCSLDDRREKVAYRHKPVMQQPLKMVKNFGVNPKRQHK